MPLDGNVDRDSVAVLYKGGRLPSWDALSRKEQDASSQEHVDLMLSVAAQHGMTRLEGFKLLEPQQGWQRFWVIEFPDAGGAEAWIEAEMAPSYGLYGYYEYYLARPWRREYLETWVANPQPPVEPARGDPHRIRVHGVDTDSIVVLTFARWRPGVESMDPDERGDPEHVKLMQSVARDHGLMRLEAFRLVAPQADWRRAWLAEFPTVEGAEAWIEAETKPPHSMFSLKAHHFTRKWSPRYFASWTKWAANNYAAGSDRH